MSTVADQTDLEHMRAALRLARRALGQAWPNPAVGCVIVRDGRVIARGWTQPGGRPHAETEALDVARSDAAGASVYVSLEPCCHHGLTPPCTQALIQARVARVVAACDDPDPRVSGAGFADLRGGGVQVDIGVLAAEAAELNAGFFLRLREGRPLVTLKLATSLDGRIATSSGESRWITGEAARSRAHALRASHDAVMIGIGTAIADDPELTCRLPGLGARSPIRIVVDPRLRLPASSRLVQTARRTPTWLIALAAADEGRRAALRSSGVEIIDLPAAPGGEIEAAAMLRALGGKGLTRVLVEGGGRLSAALLRADLVDRMEWFRAGRVIGGDGVSAAAALGIASLAEAPSFRRTGVMRCGEDVVESFARRD